MKLNVAYPATGCQKVFDIDDEKKVRIFYEKRMAQEVDASPLGDEWKGYVFRISGGNDKQGFPMKQGVLTNQRVRLLLSKGHSCYRPRRDGERKRKSVRGCIVDANLSVLSLVIVRKGAQDIPGLTDSTVPRRLGPKRASKIRKLFNLSKTDDVRKYVLRRPIAVKEGKKPRTKAPKIQRLITPLVLQRKRHRICLKRRRAQKVKTDRAEYTELLAKLAKERQHERQLRRRSSASHRTSTSTDTAPPATKAKPTSTAATAKPVAASKGATAAATKAVKPAAAAAAKPQVAAKTAKPAAKKSAAPPTKKK